MKQQKLVWISGFALLLCIASAIFAANISVSDVDRRPDWDSFGTSIWITVLITLPSLSIFLVTAAMALIKGLKR